MPAVSPPPPAAESPIDRAARPPAVPAPAPMLAPPPAADPGVAAASAAATDRGTGPAGDPPPPKWWSNPKSLVTYVLGLNDTAHQIALGVAVGMFWGMTPTVGAQMLIVLGFYYACKPLFHFNVKAALVTVYVSNPVTMLAIYWFDYEVGRLLVGGDLTKAELAAVLEYSSLAEWWETVTGLVKRVGLPMLVGSACVGLAGALAAYPLTRWLVVSWRGRREDAAGGAVG